MTKREIAELLSRAEVAKVADKLAEDIEWNMFEESMSVKGKNEVIEFAEKTFAYFQTVETKFETTGVIGGDDKIAIYGTAEFIRDDKTVNRVNSCDVYEFDGNGYVSKINSYCNSEKTGK